MKWSVTPDMPISERRPDRPEKVIAACMALHDQGQEWLGPQDIASVVDEDWAFVRGVACGAQVMYVIRLLVEKGLLERKSLGRLRGLYRVTNYDFTPTEKAE